MRIRRWNYLLTAASSAVVLLALLLTAHPGTSAQAPVPPVISLKKFIDVSQWQLDVTWSGKDAYSNANQTAKLELSATARFILKQLDKKDAWGRWQALSVQSQNCHFSSSVADNRGAWRTDYKSTAGPVTGPAAVLQVGGNTPGYQLNCQVAFPVQGTGTQMGTFPTFVVLTTQGVGTTGSLESCSGPLPAGDANIHGSLTIPMDIAPFVAPLPKTRVGIQVVLQPLVALAPLVPKTK